MRKRILQIVLIVLSSFAVLKYLTEDGRPEKDEVFKEFTTRHPERIVEKVTITYDEVIARSFAITYRIPEDSHIRQEEWHYVENNEGIWTRVTDPTPN